MAKISGSTIWRWPGEAAIKRWHYRSWIFHEILNLNKRRSLSWICTKGGWGSLPLWPDKNVISADEKTSTQARHRRHPSLPPKSNEGQRVEFEYKRKGAPCCYIAAWDVRRGKLFGRCEARSGILSFDRLVQEVMEQEPYHCAKRIFWIVNNGSSHRGESAAHRLQEKWPNLVLIHLPIHASWLNQIEIYFSILQRKVLTPNDFSSLDALKDRILGFQERYEQIAKPFEWKFTREDLSKILGKLSESSQPMALVA